MKIGEVVFVKGIIDEIRKDVVIIRNKGGYFGTVPEEIQTDIGDYSEQLWLNSRNRAFNEVLEIIDTAQTYKMYPGEEDTYIDKRVLREAVMEMKGDEQGGEG